VCGVKRRSAALQVLKHQPESAGEHFRVMQNVDDFARLTVVFEDETVAEVQGFDLSISGIRNELCIITDFAQYDIRVNPTDENELFMPDGALAGNILLREKLPTPQGTSFPRPRQFHAHGYVNEMDDAVEHGIRGDGGRGVCGSVCGYRGEGVSSRGAAQSGPQRGGVSAPGVVKQSMHPPNLASLLHCSTIILNRVKYRTTDIDFVLS
jgi:hypothetical protein